MEPTNITTKAVLDAVKSMPAWLLLGLLVSLVAISQSPPLLEPVPEAVRPALVPALIVLSILTVFRLAATALAAHQKQARWKLARDRERSAELYRPLMALFLDRHITMCSSSTPLRYRVQNARQELGHYRSQWVGIKRSWRALFDRQESTSGEIEYGGDFPLSQIIKIVKREAALADERLLGLVNRAGRSHYEQPGSALLTDEELALYHHIENEDHRLAVRTGAVG